MSGKIITEDSKAGFQFFKALGKECIPAGGKSNVSACMMKENEAITLVIADGAAFGPEVEEVLALSKRYPNYSLYLPESFEWILLKANLLEEEFVMDILLNPSDYIESKEFFSWERFFTNCLTELLKSKAGWMYVKKKLNPIYLEEENKKKILHVIQEAGITL